MEAWLSAHGLAPVARPVAEQVAPPPEDSAPAPVITQEQLGGRRSKSSDVLKKQLTEVTDGMPGRDLEKVVAFAEFLKARRAARSYSSRSDSSRPASPTSGSDDSDDVPPSQRRATER
jgi:hypothetical protein